MMIVDGVISHKNTAAAMYNTLNDIPVTPTGWSDFDESNDFSWCFLTGPSIHPSIPLIEHKDIGRKP